MRSTQPLPSPDSAPNDAHDTHPLSVRWRRLRPALLLFAGGAACSWLASGLMSHALSGQSPPRSLPTSRAKAKATPIRMSREEWRRQNPGDASFIDASGAPAPDVEASVLPASAVASVPDMSGVAVEVADSNQDGTAWKGFVARSDDDRRRLAERREEDRSLAERRVLEAQKRRIERELEVKALQEKYRAEDKQAQDAAREEDKRRIQSRVEEDKRHDESERNGQQLAEAPGGARGTSP